MMIGLDAQLILVSYLYYAVGFVEIILVGKKTAYLLARLGVGEYDPIASAAINRNISSSKSYERDCATIRRHNIAKGV